MGRRARSPGLFDEAELEIAWVEEHAVALVES
jgi:hypothetical protein